MKSSESNIKQDDLCPICLTVFYKPNKLKTCNHIFCGPCIDEATDMYEHKKCPLCRKNFVHTDKLFMEERHKQLQKLYPEEIKSKIAGLKQNRFYRVEIGNTTQVLNTESNNKYRWTLYVKPAIGEQQLVKFVEKVEVKLHPTFNPSKIQFSGDEEVQVKRLGWGTFRIDIKITWLPKYGGFVEVFHDLQFQPKVCKILTCKLGKQKNS